LRMNAVAHSMPVDPEDRLALLLIDADDSV